MPVNPLITAIKRDSVEDGPGIRSVAFFKGCPLRCIFCQNPETQDPKVEIAFSESRCIGCGECKRACPNGAADASRPGRIDRSLCERCGACADVCPGGGLRRVGAGMSPGELASELLKDEAFFRESGGGVTLSGGECTLYPDYLGELLEVLKSRGIHVAIQTSGYFDFDRLAERVLPMIDIIYYDIKLSDPEGHRKFTGRGNGLILDNFRRLMARMGIDLRPRVPVIPGVTDTRENLSGIIDILRGAGAKEVRLLPYNPIGLAMHGQLGRTPPPLPESFMSPRQEKRLWETFQGLVESSTCSQ